MIVLTRLDGTRVGINADHIERVDETPHTVVHLGNGNAYIVAEPLDEVVDLAVGYQWRIRTARERPVRPRGRPEGAPHLTLATDPQAEPSPSPAQD